MTPTTIRRGRSGCGPAARAVPATTSRIAGTKRTRRSARKPSSPPSPEWTGRRKLDLAAAGLAAEAAAQSPLARITVMIYAVPRPHFEACLQAMSLEPLHAGVGAMIRGSARPGVYKLPQRAAVILHTKDAKSGEDSEAPPAVVTYARKHGGRRFALPALLSLAHAHPTSTPESRPHHLAWEGAGEGAVLEGGHAVDQSEAAPARACGSSARSGRRRRSARRALFPCRACAPHRDRTR